MADIVFKSKDSMMNLVNLVNEAADAVGKVFGSGKGTGAFVLAAPVVALITSGVITPVSYTHLTLPTNSLV